jgi:hypothetical protein
MLTAILARATLTERERESFVDMWDRIHRFNRCSDKQRSWIEKVYYGQKLDREAAAPVKRRVVVPSWQKDDVRDAQPVAAPMQPAVVSRAGFAEPGLVKTNARLIMQRRQSGTFRIPTAVEQQPEAISEKKIGYINYPGVQRETLVTSLPDFENVCPRIAPGSKQYEKIAGFFERGGVVLKVKPLEAQVA